MSDVVIRVENLSKRYTIQHQNGDDGLRHAIHDFATAPLRWLRRQHGAWSDKHGAESSGHGAANNGNGSRPPSPVVGQPTTEEFWALKDVSFEVKRGEVVGVIGRNGAGKSTLLKILSRITEPTEGSVRIRGRVASLLEVGTGFHPELTGRENIFVNGAILGMTRAEIKAKFDEIVAFAEIEKFLDTPVKRYSSGMYVRLAFAVAAHLEPEILVVDEVLAVGDAVFQKKCLRKMGEVAKGGRTVLFVSHNMTAIKSLCRRTIWLDKGIMVGAGEAELVVDDYLHNGTSSVFERMWHDPAAAPGNDIVRLHQVSITPVDQGQDESITVKTPLQLSIAFWNYLPGTVLNFSVVLYSVEGIAIFNTRSIPHAFPEGLVWGSFVIPGDLLNDGAYMIRLLIVKDTSVPLLDLNDLLAFEVLDCERMGNWYGKLIGAVRPRFDWVLRTSS